MSYVRLFCTAESSVPRAPFPASPAASEAPPDVPTRVEEGEEEARPGSVASGQCRRQLAGARRRKFQMAALASVVGECGWWARPLPPWRRGGSICGRGESGWRAGVRAEQGQGQGGQSIRVRADGEEGRDGARVLARGSGIDGRDMCGTRGRPVRARSRAAARVGAPSCSVAILYHLLILLGSWLADLRGTRGVGSKAVSIPRNAEKFPRVQGWDGVHIRRAARMAHRSNGANHGCGLATCSKKVRPP